MHEIKPLNRLQFLSQVDWGAARSNLALLSVAGGLGLLGGILASRGSPELIAVFVGLVLAFFVMLSREASFWFVVICAFLLAGSFELYLPGAAKIRFGAPLASVGLLLHLVLDVIGRDKNTQQTETSVIMRWAGCFALTAFLSTLVNLSDIGVALEGYKNYFQMWIFFVVIAFTRWRPSFVNLWPKAFLLIALAQIPLVVHQYCFLVPKRIGLGGRIVPVDVVAGSFGASLYGGGASATLAIFLVVVVSCLLALWKNGVMTPIRVMPLVGVLLTPLIVNEVKIAVFYLPLVFLVIFRRDLLQKPLRFLAVGGAVAGALAILLTALTVNHVSGRLKTWSEFVSHVAVEQTSDLHERRGEYDELTRVTSLTFWVREHRDANLAHMLLGHGPGASRVQVRGVDLGSSFAEQHYGGMIIAPTAVTALLWDTGIVGLVVVLAMFTRAFRVAGWLSRQYTKRDDFKASLFEGLQAGVAVLMLSLIHKDSLIDHIPSQTLVYLIIGAIAFSELQLIREGRISALCQTTTR